MVDMKEMRAALSAFDLGLSAAQLDSLIHVFFSDAKHVNGIPKIAVKAFLGRFAMVYRHADDVLHSESRTPEQRLAHEAMEKIGHVLAVTPLDKIERAVLSRPGAKAAAAKGKAKAKADPKAKAKADPRSKS